MRIVLASVPVAVDRLAAAAPQAASQGATVLVLSEAPAEASDGTWSRDVAALAERESLLGGL